MTLDELHRHFSALYGRRNRRWLPSLVHRAIFFGNGLADLLQAHRYEMGSEAYSLCLARIVSRIFCVADYFYPLPFGQSLSAKFPPINCRNCLELPCVCLTTGRPDARLLEKWEIDRQFIERSLTEISSDLRTLYNEANQQQGLDKCLLRLSRESSEVANLALAMQSPSPGLTDFEFELTLELADAIAWTAAVANLWDIDLERAVLDRFYPVCWKCKENPCLTCGEFSLKLIDWKRDDWRKRF